MYASLAYGRQGGRMFECKIFVIRIYATRCRGGEGYSQLILPKYHVQIRVFCSKLSNNLACRNVQVKYEVGKLRFRLLLRKMVND